MVGISAFVSLLNDELFMAWAGEVDAIAGALQFAGFPDGVNPSDAIDSRYLENTLSWLSRIMVTSWLLKLSSRGWDWLRMISSSEALNTRGNSCRA